MKCTLSVLLLLSGLFSVLLSAGEPEPITPLPGTRFGGGERIKIVINPDPTNASFEQLVTDDGYITLPTGGDPVNIKGKTYPEAQQIVNERVKADAGVKKITASIAILSIPVRNIFVGGDGIKTNLAVPITGGVPMRLYSAILAAGGISPDGDPVNISVLHTAKDGKIESSTIDVSHIGERGNNLLGPILEPGDVVIVPRGETIILAGEVTKPGTVNKRDIAAQTGKTLRVSSVLYATGGLKSGANRKNVKILRNGPDGNKLVLAADLEAAEKPSPVNPAPPPSGQKPLPAPDPDPVLQSGDVVIVAPTGSIPILGKVRAPGTYPINGQSIKLSRIVAMAGGFADFAKTSQVTVLKGGNSPIQVDMSQLRKGGDFNDVELEDGDIVFVGERLL